MIFKRLKSIYRRLKENEVRNPTLGIAWYAPEQWPRLLEVSIDAHHLEKTHGEWLAFAEKQFAELTQKGVPVRKIPVDVVDMAAWCREMGREVDGPGRAAYVVWRLEWRPPSRVT